MGRRARVRATRPAEPGRRSPSTDNAASTSRTSSRCGIFDALAEGVLVVDHRGRIQAMNPSAERVLGFPRGTLVGQNVRDTPWVLENEQDRRLRIDEWPIVITLERGEPSGQLLVTHRPDGERRVIVMIAMPLPRPGGTPWTVVSLMDVTRERRAAARALGVGGQVPPARRPGARPGVRRRPRRDHPGLQPADGRRVRLSGERSRRPGHRDARARECTGRALHRARGLHGRAEQPRHGRGHGVVGTAARRHRIPDRGQPEPDRHTRRSSGRGDRAATSPSVCAPRR